MNRNLRNILSFLALGFFLLTAINSLPASFSEQECGDEKNLLFEKIPSSSQISTIRIRTVDHRTNEPLSGMKVHMFLVIRFMTDVSLGDNYCPEEGAMSTWYLDEVKSVTNSEGLATTSQIWFANDKKDRLIGVITAEDPSYNFVPLETNIKADQDDPVSTYTLRMIHKDLL